MPLFVFCAPGLMFVPSSFLEFRGLTWARLRGSLLSFLEEALQHSNETPGIAFELRDLVWARLCGSLYAILAESRQLID